MALGEGARGSIQVCAVVGGAAWRLSLIRGALAMLKDIKWSERSGYLRLRTALLPIVQLAIEVQSLAIPVIEKGSKSK